MKSKFQMLFLFVSNQENSRLLILLLQEPLRSFLDSLCFDFSKEHIFNKEHTYINTTQNSCDYRSHIKTVARMTSLGNRVIREEHRNLPLKGLSTGKSQLKPPAKH